MNRFKYIANIMNRFKYIAVIILSLFVFNISRAAELTPEQKKFQTSIHEFLKEEGFSPTIDEDDNSINFKKEGALFWIWIGGSSPIYLEFHRSGFKCEDADRNLVLQSVNSANRNVRCAKAILKESSVSFAIEMYCHSSEEFKYVFYKCLNELENVKNKVYEYYNEPQDANVNSNTYNSNSTDISKFFPVYGFTPGQSTVDDMKAKGYNVKTIESGDHYCNVKDLTFWDHDCDNIFEDIYITHYNYLPESWDDKLGFNWRLSYNQIIAKFQNWGYRIDITKSPTVKKYQGRKTLSADVTATSSDGHIAFHFDFNYGNSEGEGYSTNSPNTLYSITIRTK